MAACFLTRASTLNSAANSLSATTIIIACAFHHGWYFRGFLNGHVIELVGRAGTAETLDGAGTDVPFYDRYYLGGLYDLRGYHYRPSARASLCSRGSRSAATPSGSVRWNTACRFSSRTKKKGLGSASQFSMILAKCIADAV